jgi:hypothetical protein
VSDQLELGRLLQTHIVRDRQLLGARSQFSEGCPPPAGVAQHPPLDVYLRSGYSPRVSGRRHQSRLFPSAGLPVADEGPLHRIGRPGHLQRPTEVGVAIHVAARPDAVGGVDHANRIEVRFKFLCH